MDAHIGLGFQEVHLFDNLKHQIGQVIGGVLALGIHSGQGYKLTERRIDALIGPGPALIIIDIIVFDPPALQPFLGGLLV